MLAALVIFGAVACTEKEVAPEQNAGMSFTATIDLDETRTDVVFNEDEKVWETVWTGNETLFVRSGYMSYPFKNSVDNKNVFTCSTAPDLKGKDVTITLGHDEYGTQLNSMAGKAGGSMQYTGTFTENISISVNSAFLRFKSASDVALQASAPIFVVNGQDKDVVQLTAGDDVWVAVKQMYGVTLSAIIDGETIKSKENLDFVAKKIYNLGELAKFEPVASEYGVVGSFQGWDVAAGKPVVMYVEGDWAVAKGVELYKDDEFKIVKGNSWDTSFGLSSVGVVEENKEVAVTSSNSQNMKVAKNGKFDISFNATTNKIMVVCVEEYADLMVNITINNKANWSPLYITLKDGNTIVADNAIVTGNMYQVSGDYIGKNLTCTLSNGSKTSEVMNVAITKTGATITLEETIIKLTVKLVKSNSKQWWGDTMKIHVWNTGTSFDTTWPGNTMTSEGNYTWSIIVPSELVGETIDFLVHNGNGWQSANSQVEIMAEGNTVDDYYLNIN